MRKKRCCVVVFALQTMFGFYMECYTGLKWVKREYWSSKLESANIVNRTQNSSEICKPLWRLSFGRGSVVRPPSNGEGLRGSQHSMSMVLDMGFHVWFIMTLYYKIRHILWQNETAILSQNALGFLLQNVPVLLQNATVIPNCDDFITKCDSYYKIRRLSQITTVHCSPNRGRLASHYQ